jgi:hypothetical protein
MLSAGFALASFAAPARGAPAVAPDPVTHALPGQARAVSTAHRWAAASAPVPGGRNPVGARSSNCRVDRRSVWPTRTKENSSPG